jgi:hypothetical protein
MNKQLPWNELLDRNPATCPEDAFNFYNETDMAALVWREWEALRPGTVGRNYIDGHKRLVSSAIDIGKSVAEAAHCDRGAERRRGQVDTGRVCLQIAQWVRAVAAKGEVPVNLLPRLPELLKPRPMCPFKLMAQVGETMAEWCAARVDTLLDASRVRVQVIGGLNRLTIRPGTFSAEELDFARRWSVSIATFISDAFVDVDTDSRNGLLRQHGLAA